MNNIDTRGCFVLRIMSGVRYYEIKPSLCDSYMIKSELGETSILTGNDFFNMFDQWLKSHRATHQINVLKEQHAEIKRQLKVGGLLSEDVIALLEDCSAIEQKILQIIFQH